VGRHLDRADRSSLGRFLGSPGRLRDSLAKGSLAKDRGRADP
jgi:hypothetical protein